MLDHISIVRPGLDENVTWLRDFGRQFGPLMPHVFDQHNHPESFEISIIARHNVTAASRKKTIPALAFWHLDVSYVENPSDAIFFIQRNFEAKAIK
jgi:alpha-ketoglutarate-dependent taurine dioxygenase|tara:strand:+ start:253 stop:540 length:288 start_codon:yes stop_codon:yes gene_type:complete